MKKNQILGMMIFALLFSFSIVSCSDDDDEEPAITDFVADDSTFANGANWEWVATDMGAGTETALGAAHGAAFEDVERKTYIKDNESRGSNGEYPIGTLVYKSMLSTSDSTEVEGYFGMAKRGEGYSTLGDWEWFILNADGSIKVTDGVAERGGADFKACGSCHAAAIANDFTFSK